MSEQAGVTAEGLTANPTWERLEDQLHWYSKKSAQAQRNYRRAKIAQLLVGSAVPIVALLVVPAVITATLGAIVVLVEALQQLYQWQTNFVLYRSTSESLKHEKYLFLAKAGPYKNADPIGVLAEKIEGLVSQEHAKWTQTQERVDRPTGSNATQAN